MSDLSIAFITIFGTVASVTGVILFVFNGTKKLIKEMHQTLKEMHETQIELARQAEQRHMEIVELLKKGFGEVITEIRKES